MHSRTLVLLAIILAVGAGGCVQSIAVSTVGGIVDDGFEAFTQEQDLVLAEQALPGNLKLLEVMLKTDPDNERLLRLLSMGYNSYALGFVEDVDVDRARMFYLRARDFGMRILRHDTELGRALAGPVDQLVRVLASRSKHDVPAVFWTAFGWGSYINLTLTSPDAIADLPRVEAMMKFVAAKDSSFYYGGAYVFLGTLYGSRSKFLGGDTDLSKQYFEAALRINKGRFLMTQVYYARSCAVQTLNEALFDELLKTVDDTPLDVLPEFRLANAIAKKKAALLMARKSELF